MLTLGRAGAGKSHQSCTKKLICFDGGAESLPPHLHLVVALRSGRRGDTPPVGRQDAVLKAKGGEHAGPGHSHQVCSFSRWERGASARIDARYTALSAGQTSPVDIVPPIVAFGGFKLVLLSTLQD